MDSAGAGGGEVGWYVLGPNQEHVGPYALSELQGMIPPPLSISANAVLVRLQVGFSSRKPKLSCTGLLQSARFTSLRFLCVSASFEAVAKATQIPASDVVRLCRLGVLQ